MGFTALDGLPMGRRSGQIDPGVILYLMSEKGMTPADVQKFLYHECGLKGLSGISNDMRQLEISEDPAAAFAIEHFAYRIGLYAGMLAAALHGWMRSYSRQGLVKTSAHVRAAIAERLTWLGVSLDAGANSKHARLISRPESRVAVYVLPTDEELMIARHTIALLSSAPTAQPKHEKTS
jgi:acetate kinase